jgi:hypothetical protein
MTEYICEVCEKPAVDGLHDEQEGTMFCGSCAVSLIAGECDRYREAIDQALGLIETASSRARILKARDVLRAAVERRKGSPT